jgi:hypothetical protein
LLFAMRDARRTFRRAGELVVREGGGARAWLWFKWKLHWQWSLLAVAAVMPMIVAVAPIELSSLPLISVVLCILLAKSATRSR